MRLTAVTFLPALGALVLLFVPRRTDATFKVGGLAVSLVAFLLSVSLFVGFDDAVAAFQFKEVRAWMPGFGISYHLGIDAITLLLVRLTTFLTLVALAFAIKVPLFPFHTWLPDAHVEAPTAGSVILAGVLLKMGTYGFLRFCLPLFPGSSLTFGPPILALSVIGIVYGAWVSTVQPDMKKLVAYSSVSHLGFVMLGIFTLTPQGLVGGVIQMVNHGLSTGALFLLVGMIYERRHTRLIADFGGLWSVVPAFSALFMVVVLSSLGLPGLNGFVGEFLVLVGAFQTSPWLAAVATSGIIFAAVYLLWMYQRVIFGEVTNPENRSLRDLDLREWALLAPVMLFIVWIGVYPIAFTGKMEATVDALIAAVQSKASVAMVTTVKP